MPYRRQWKVKSTPSNPAPIANSIRWDNLVKAYKVTFKFDRNIVDLLKMTIPTSDRSYNPKTHEWMVAEQYFDGIKMLLEVKYGKENVHILTKSEVEKEWAGFNSRPVARSIEDDLTTFKELLTEAGLTFDAGEDKNKIKRVYYRAIMFFHPDRNPQYAEKASKLNAAWQALQEHFGFESRQMEQQV